MIADKTNYPQLGQWHQHWNIYLSVGRKFCQPQFYFSHQHGHGGNRGIEIHLLWRNYKTSHDIKGFAGARAWRLLYEKYCNRLIRILFPGEWDTRSKGKVTDFNLMLKAAQQVLHHHHLNTDHSAIFKSGSHFILYVASGAQWPEIFWWKQVTGVFEDDTELKFYAETDCDFIEINAHPA